MIRESSGGFVKERWRSSTGAAPTDAIEVNMTTIRHATVADCEIPEARLVIILLLSHSEGCADCVTTRITVGFLFV